jgi:hypothetical protein
MTEPEWLTCNDPQPMLEFLRGRASERKLRLFAVACCRRIWHLLPDQRCRRAIRTAEDFAEGKGGVGLLRKVEEAGEFYYDNREDVLEERLGYFTGGAIFQLGQERLASDIVAAAASGAVACSTLDAGGDRLAADAAKHGESAAQCQLLRDIVGNPFHSVSVDPAWPSWDDGSIPKLAQVIYDDRAFDRLPILADALEEAGCTDADILNHCRQGGEHVRGCWVVDLVLGKADCHDGPRPTW